MCRDCVLLGQLGLQENLHFSVVLTVFVVSKSSGSLLQEVGAAQESPFFFCAYALTASIACSDPRGSPEMVSETRAAAICDARTSLCEESIVSRVTTYNTLSTTRSL